MVTGQHRVRLTRAGAAVVAVRLAVPLSIVRWPLPGAAFAAVLDAADVVLVDVIARRLKVPVGFGPRYPQIDKWLDSYYLGIETIQSRSWPEVRERRVAAALAIHRFVGVFAFEMTGDRRLLLAFAEPVRELLLVRTGEPPTPAGQGAPWIRGHLEAPGGASRAEAGAEWVLHVAEIHPWQLIEGWSRRPAQWAAVTAASVLRVTSTTSQRVQVIPMATTATTLIDSLNNELSDERVRRISDRIGADPDRTKSAISDALPLLVGAIGAEASDPTAAPGLTRALADDHDGSLLDDLDEYLTGNVSGRRADGAGILKHALGDRQPAAEEAVARKSGLDMSSIGPLLSLLAPIVMNMLGRKRQQSGASGGFGLDDLLGGILGGGSTTSTSAPRTQSQGLDDLLGSLLGGSTSSNR